MRGYLRPDGRVGIRNRVLVLPTVGCANHVAARIASAVPGCVTLPNSKGCGQVGTGIQIMSALSLTKMGWRPRQLVPKWNKLERGGLARSSTPHPSLTSI